MFQGGSGTDAIVLPAYGERNQPKGNTPALARGFAVVTTDGGHEDKDSSFGLDAKARTDWGYHSIDIVTQVASLMQRPNQGLNGSIKPDPGPASMAPMHASNLRCNYLIADQLGCRVSIRRSYSIPARCCLS